MSGTPDISLDVVTAFQCAETLDMAAELQGSATYRLAVWYARQATRRDQCAKDIASNALALAHGRRDQFRGTHVAQFRAWLAKIVRNCARDYYRREWKRTDRFELTPELLQFVAANTPSPEEQFLIGELLDQVRAQVLSTESCLNESERTALRLTGWHEMEANEVANDMQLTPAQVATLLHSGRSKLREHLSAIGLLDPGEKVIRNRLEYGFAPTSGQRRTQATHSEGNQS